MPARLIDKHASAGAFALLFGVAVAISGCGGGSTSSADLGGVQEPATSTPSQDDSDNTGSTPATKTVTVSWVPPATRANGDPISLGELGGYWVRYGTQQGSHGQGVFVAGANTTQQQIDDLTVGETYYFVVSAQDVDGLESPPSQETMIVLQ